jgi:type II secretory pathway component PulM
MRDPAETDADLYHRLDQLLKIAEHAGIDSEWLDQTAGHLATMFREVAALRANARDPRRARTLLRAARLNAMLDRSRRMGLSARAAHAAARAQLGIDKYQFARLLPWAERLRNVAHPPWTRIRQTEDQAP